MSQVTYNFDINYHLSLLISLPPPPVSVSVIENTFRSHLADYLPSVLTGSAPSVNSPLRCIRSARNVATDRTGYARVQYFCFKMYYKNHKTERTVHSYTERHKTMIPTKLNYYSLIFVYGCKKNGIIKLVQGCTNVGEKIKRKYDSSTKF